jgi:hypothetical protein
MPSVDGTTLRSPQRTIFGRYRTNNGQILILVGGGHDAIDPQRSLALRCGEGFDTGFSPINVLA